MEAVRFIGLNKFLKELTNEYMIYTQKIQHAIRFATKTHEGYQKHKRKGKDVPYIVHPLTVGLILASVGAKEDLIIAGILHDTIEDSREDKKPFMPERIEERFGKKVLDLVMSVTEQNKALSWEERKMEAMDHIKTFSHDSLLLKSADIISNMSETIDDYSKRGEEVFKIFKAPKEVKLNEQIYTIEIILERWSETPLADELNNLLLKIKAILENKEEIDYYLNEELQKVRRIVYVACEDEEGCGFIVEFKYSNCTFFFCKEHKMGFNIDLNTVTNAGVECKQHGKMERYNVLTEDNVCPVCEKNTLAILSTGVN